MKASPAVRVRRARRADATAIVDMARGLAAWLDNSSPAIDRDAVLRNCFGRNRWCDPLVADLAGAVVGYAIYCRTFEGHIGNRQIYLSDLYVRPEARCSGAGRALMKTVARRALALGCTAVTWELWTGNALGRGFYERLGARVADDVNPMRLTSPAVDALARN